MYLLLTLVVLSTNLYTYLFINLLFNTMKNLSEIELTNEKQIGSLLTLPMEWVIAKNIKTGRYNLMEVFHHGQFKKGAWRYALNKGKDGSLKRSVKDNGCHYTKRRSLENYELVKVVDMKFIKEFEVAFIA